MVDIVIFDNVIPFRREGRMSLRRQRSVKEVFETLTEEQKNVVYFMIGTAIEDTEKKLGRQL